ncbi:hypothetical protein OAR43_09300 [Gammaproteobacteria bacterium]|nr:hypothetical protein [Gammaproteobacteria bacterium]
MSIFTRSGKINVRKMMKDPKFNNPQVQGMILGRAYPGIGDVSDLPFTLTRSIDNSSAHGFKTKEEAESWAAENIDSTKGTYSFNHYSSYDAFSGRGQWVLHWEDAALKEGAKLPTGQDATFTTRKEPKEDTGGWW